MSLPATLRLGPVQLTVGDLDRSIEFYESALGLRVQGREDGTAALGAGGEELVVLHGEPGARPAGRHAGLYHFALLFPSRPALARAVQRLVVARAAVTGASDHGVSEAIYLDDPDGNGIELYADRPRDDWPPPAPGERVGMFTRALDLRGLLDVVAGDEPVALADEGLRVGHMHLHVGDLGAAREFYADGLGFEVMASMPSALFLAVGGYHHQLGLNTWRGEGVGPPPPGTVGLREWTLVLPRDAPEVLEDPWGIRLRLT